MSLPDLNAALNAGATLLLVAGYVQIKRGRKAAHKACMLSACAVSAAFLVSYLVHHARAGHVVYPGTGAMRGLYLAILLTHTVLAAAVPFLAAVTVWRAFRGDWERHKRLARWTFPIWLYVSVTGIAVYLMLYRGLGL